MKITWESTDYGQIGLHAELDDYDASPPVKSLLIDCAPLSMNPDRLAIAAYLAFGHWVSGDLKLPHKLGPATAAAIERDLKHVDIRPSPIEYYPKPLEIGVRDISLKLDSRMEPSLSDATIDVLPASLWHGGIRGLRSVAVGSNAFALDSSVSSTFESIRARLAVGVLFSADLSADSLIVRSPGAIPKEEQLRITALLLAVRLGIQFT